MFKLGPVGDILYYDYDTNYPVKNYEYMKFVYFDDEDKIWGFKKFTINFRLLEYDLLVVNIVKNNKNQRSSNWFAENFNRCVRELTDPNIRYKTLSRLINKYKEYTPSSNLLGFIVGDDNFREDVLRKTIKTTKYKTYSGSFCYEYFACPFRKSECLVSKIKVIDKIRSFIRYLNFIIGKINFTVTFNNKTSLIYFNNSKLLHFIRLMNGTD